MKAKGLKLLPNLAAKIRDEKFREKKELTCQSANNISRATGVSTSNCNGFSYANVATDRCILDFVLEKMAFPTKCVTYPLPSPGRESEKLTILDNKTKKEFCLMAERLAANGPLCWRINP